MAPLVEILSRQLLPIALAAFILSGIIFWFARRTGGIPPAAWVGIVFWGLLGVSALAGFARELTPYHVFVRVVDAGGTTREDAKVWSTAEGDLRRVEGGWDLVVPASLRPGDGRLLIWAALEPSVDRVTRRNEPIPSRLVNLEPGSRHLAVVIKSGADQGTVLGGRVVDNQGEPAAGVWLSVAGFGDQAVMTQDDGSFSLAAHGAEGEDVLLLITVGRNPIETHWERAGDRALTIRLGGNNLPPE